MGWFSSGMLDGIPADIIAKSFPALTALMTTVDAHPKVISWKEAHPANYPPPA